MAKTKPSAEEADLTHRNRKKVKGGDHGFTGESSQPVCYEDIFDEPGVEKGTQPRRPSFKEAMMGESTETEDSEDDGDESDDCMESADEELSGDEKDDFEGLEVVEGKKGKYECPSFVLSEKEERRICKPWRNGVIVKLLGRKIGYKALENRLQQMWVRDGIITVVDLGNDYFLVDFSSTSDKKAALEKGPWLIYDHYLIVREWAPNFNPEKAAIEKVVVWVRFSGLPIEYYDPKVLKFIGNRIGRTVRVDNTTLL